MRTLILAPLLAGAVFAAAAADQTARPSPPFTILRAGAPELSLTQYRGKIVALAFIQTTCPHCQELTRLLGPIAREYEPRGVQFLECAFNQGADALVPQFIQQYQPPFPVGWSYDAAVRAYLGYAIFDSRVLYVPHLVLLDRRGVIHGEFPGESPFFQNPAASIRVELDKLLKAPAAPAAAKKK